MFGRSLVGSNRSVRITRAGSLPSPANSSSQKKRQHQVRSWASGTHCSGGLETLLPPCETCVNFTQHDNTGNLMLLEKKNCFKKYSQVLTMNYNTGKMKGSVTKKTKS